MRFLILSDLHANWEALEAVLGQAKGKYERILCCGDVVGYGADPDVVTEWVRQNVHATVRGNHDKACAGLEDLEWFNPVARASAEWTQRVAKPQNVGWLKALPQGPEPMEPDFQILHGSPVDEDQYVITEQDAQQVFPYVDYPLTFFGHTHLQGGFAAYRRMLRRIPQPGADGENVLELEPDGFYMINPGSVGQPRDGDPRAAYALYDSDAKTVTYRRAEYNIAGAQAKIRAAGLPEPLALRLEIGA